MEDYLLIIDGSSLLSTQFYGNLPREVLMGKTPEDKERFFHKIMQTSKGVYTNGVYGFLRALFSMLENQKPKYLAVTWDLTRDTFRRKLYPEYKGNRSDTMVPLSSQFILMQEILKRIGVAQFMSETYEADDYSGTLARKFEHDIPVRILTKDHDYLQLSDENVTIWLLQSAQSKADELFSKYDMKKDGSCPDKAFPMDPIRIEAEYGVKPTSIAALKGLMGDSSDNIKGVPGIGPQTAVALISRYLTVDNLYHAIDTNMGDACASLISDWKEKLGIKRNPMNYLLKESDTELVGRRAAVLSEQLATIKTDIELSEELEDLTIRIDSEECRKVLRELEISSIRVPDSFQNDSSKPAAFPEPEVILLDDFTMVSESLQGLAALKTVGIQYVKDEALYLYDGNKLYHVPLQFFVDEEYLAEELKALQTKGVCLCGIDLKEMLPILSVSAGIAFDASVADYLLRPLTSDHSFYELCSVYLECTKPNTPENAAILSFLLYDVLKAQLGKQSLTELYESIELPLIPVLYSMENAGIRVNRDALVEFGASMEGTILEEEAKIYELCGERFNIQSPKQLGDILFEKLKLPYGKKTKTGYSTSAEILEKLAEEHEVIPHILQYRQLTKLKSTYVDSLGSFIREDGRIHAKFNQTVTATGRLSSAEPNLQNIPIRYEMGRLIRKVFVPADGYCFIDADYSQIELRLLAHMSGDESLISAFRNGEDIHRATAAKVFGKTYEEVTPSERSAAKAVNFGIIYGISSFGLGQDLNISRKTAEEYINGYFTQYPRIKEYLDSLVNEAKKDNMARTLYGRIRPIPELESQNFMQRNFGERVAMNMPIQGTAADIMKLAMLRIDQSLRDNHLESRLLVQVHDELLIEAKESEKEFVKTLLTEAMEGAAELSVKLLVGLSEGTNWYEAK